MRIICIVLGFCLLAAAELQAEPPILDRAEFARLNSRRTLESESLKTTPQQDVQPEINIDNLRLPRLPHPSFEPSPTLITIEQAAEEREPAAGDLPAALGALGKSAQQVVRALLYWAEEYRAWIIAAIGVFVVVRFFRGP